MKILRYICILIACTCFCASCSEKVSNPVFADDETPYIYMDWAATNVCNIGDTLRFTAQVAPSEGTACRWLIDGQTMSTGRTLEYEVTSPEPFILRFEAERNGIVNYRTSNVTVTKPFEPKEYERVAMGVLCISATAASVQWDHITHLMISSLTVNTEDGQLTLPDAAALNSLKTTVSLAHNEGVYVIIDITGTLVLPGGTGIYNETAFNTVAADPALRTGLIAQIKSFVEQYDMDGVNIYINNLNNDFGGLSNEEELAAFMNELGEAMPLPENTGRGGFFITASVPQAWNNYEFSWLGSVTRLDWMNLMHFGSTDLTPCPHAADWNISDNISRFVTYGVPAEKILIGIGAFGIKYDIPAGVSATWGDIDSYLSYFPYSEIVKMDPSAPSKNMLSQGTGGLWYVGVSAPECSVEYKASLVKDNSAGGMFVWMLEYDTDDPASSLTQAVYKAMNP